MFVARKVTQRKERPPVVSRQVAIALCCAFAVLLAACRSGGFDSNDPGLTLGPATPSPNPGGEVFGQGPVRVAMLLPVSAPGNGAAVATELKNGAIMALNDFGQDSIQIVVKDTAGQAPASQSAATEAVREGAAVVLGPVFAANVSAASAITQPSGRTMIAFSTDSSVARRGVYLLSYTPQDDTRRIIRYAISQGRRSILAFLPSNAEGTIREAILRQEAGSAGANVRVIRYDRSDESIGQAVASSAEIMPGFDSIYIPEGNQIPNAILQNMRRTGVNIVNKQILGSGAWESITFEEAQLENAIYPGRDLTRFEEFARRYQQSYGARPNVWAALGYDAVTLGSDLVRRLGSDNAFGQQGLENPRGFSGINGIFRFRSDGTTERGLAIYAIVGGRPKLVVPAPTSFVGIRE